jgi:hypothetical protein
LEKAKKKGKKSERGFRKRKKTAAAAAATAEKRNSREKTFCECSVAKKNKLSADCCLFGEDRTPEGRPRATAPSHR